MHYTELNAMAEAATLRGATSGRVPAPLRSRNRRLLPLWTRSAPVAATAAPSGPHLHLVAGPSPPDRDATAC